MPGERSAPYERDRYREVFLCALLGQLLRDAPPEAALFEAVDSVITHAYPKLANLVASQPRVTAAGAEHLMGRIADQLEGELSGILFEWPIAQILPWIHDIDSLMERRLRGGA